MQHTCRDSPMSSQGGTLLWSDNGDRSNCLLRTFSCADSSEAVFIFCSYDKIRT